MKKFVDSSLLTTEAQKTNFANFVFQQEIERYKNQIQQLTATVQTLTNEKQSLIKENTGLKDAQSKNVTVSNELKEAQLEIANKDKQILSLTNEQNERIRILLSKMDAANTMIAENNTLTKEQNDKVMELKERVISIPTRIDEMKTEILMSNKELKLEIIRSNEDMQKENQETVDETLKNRFDVFELNVLTKLSNIQIPTPTPIDIVALENNIIVAISKNIKEHIDAMPKVEPTTETSNMQEFSDKIMLEFDKRMERQADLMNERFDIYDEKMELLMKAKEIKTSKHTIDPTIDLPSDIPLKHTIDPTIDDTDVKLKPTIRHTIDIPSGIPLNPTIKEEKIITYLKKNQPQINKQISEALDLDESNTLRTLTTMVKKSFLLKDNKDRYSVK